jgi:hypothetical protein
MDIKQIKKYQSILSIIFYVWISIVALLCIFYAINNLKKTTIVLIDEDERIIDSLKQEILLRDILINQCKDTTYGEETTITNNNR